MTLIKVKERGRETVNLGRRNLIINGAMQVAQRGTTTGVTVGYGGSDRFQFARGGAAVVSLSKDTDVPTGQGFSSSQKVDVTTSSDMSGSGNYAMIRQKIEGQNLQHLLYGTSSAKKITLQFWVKSPKTGIHVIELYHGDAAYFNSIRYTIASANTWQKVTATFDGYQPTALDNDNGIGFQLAWWLGASTTYNSGTHTDNSWHNDAAKRAVGQVNVMDNTANNFYLTGVQLEVGETATDFEHLSFGEDLSLCQRYYWKHTAEDYGTNQGATTSALAQWSTTSAYGLMNFPVEMRAKPSGSYSNLSHFTLYVSGQTRTPTSWTMATRGGRWGTEHHFDWSSGITAAGGGWLRFQSGSGWYAYEAEL